MKITIFFHKNLFNSIIYCNFAAEIRIYKRKYNYGSNIKKTGHFGYKIETLPSGEKVVVVYEALHELLFD